MTNLLSESKMEAALHSRGRRLMLGLAAALATMALVAPTALAGFGERPLVHGWRHAASGRLEGRSVPGLSSGLRGFPPSGSAA